MAPIQHHPFKIGQRKAKATFPSKKLFTRACIAGVTLCMGLSAAAANEVPCLVFTGNSETENRLDLSKFNRISFGDKSMTITSSNHSETIELLYSLFHHLEIKNAIPTDLSGITEIIEDSEAQLLFDSSSKFLRIDADSDTAYQLGIFNMKGYLLATSELRGGESVSIEGLESGIYVAVATDGNRKLTIKFILN